MKALDFSLQRRVAEEFVGETGLLVEPEFVDFSTGRDGFTVAFQLAETSPQDYSNRIYVHPAGESGWGAFRYPLDPGIPAFELFANPLPRRKILSQLFHNQAEPTAQLLSYRPLRRAVFRLASANQAYFVKVVRPSRIESVVKRHQFLFERGLPVPKILWWSPSGALIISAVEGQSMFDAILSPAVTPSLGPWLTARSTLAQLSDTPFVRESSLRSVEWAFSPLQTLYPDRTGDLNHLQASIEKQQQLERQTPAAQVASHGDLHFSQILVDQSGQSMVGLIDLDSFGMGSEADDIAAFGSQLTLLRLSVQIESPSKAPGVTKIRSDWSAWLAELPESLKQAVAARASLQLSLLALSQRSCESGLGDLLINEAQQQMSIF